MFDNRADPPAVLSGAVLSGAVLRISERRLVRPLDSATAKRNIDESCTLYDSQRSVIKWQPRWNYMISVVCASEGIPPGRQLPSEPTKEPSFLLLPPKKAVLICSQVSFVIFRRMRV
jgi:hypothetical protein